MNDSHKKIKNTIQKQSQNLKNKQPKPKKQTFKTKRGV